MRCHTSFVLGLVLVSTSASHAQDRVPGDHWLRFADPRQAGFDTAQLEAVREAWERLPSSAFMVVADGAVVAAWGNVDRRFMCHSVRRSFLSALYGIYWDRGAIELNKTLADIGLDDEPSPLLETEKTARILDLLKARSGVFHPAAYAGRTDSRPRGSEGAGRFFAYNNWDFNTLAAILEMETSATVFEAFDEFFGQPLGMEDWRVSDGYFHYERDKSQYPAYPFRLSARDAARFGLLFARLGMWGDEKILSRHWVRRSTALYSIDNDEGRFELTVPIVADARLLVTKAGFVPGAVDPGDPIALASIVLERPSTKGSNLVGRVFSAFDQPLGGVFVTNGTTMGTSGPDGSFGLVVDDSTRQLVAFAPGGG